MYNVKPSTGAPLEDDIEDETAAGAAGTPLEDEYRLRTLKDVSAAGTPLEDDSAAGAPLEDESAADLSSSEGLDGAYNPFWQRLGLRNEQAVKRIQSTETTARMLRTVERSLEDPVVGMTDATVERNLVEITSDTSDESNARRIQRRQRLRAGRKAPAPSEPFSQARANEPIDESSDDDTLADEGAADPTLEDEGAAGNTLQDESATAAPLEDLSAAGNTLQDESAAGTPLEDESAAAAPLEDLNAAGDTLEDENAAGTPLEDDNAAGVPLEDDCAGTPLEDESAAVVPLEDEAADGTTLEDDNAAGEPLEERLLRKYDTKKPSGVHWQAVRHVTSCGASIESLAISAQYLRNSEPKHMSQRLREFGAPFVPIGRRLSHSGPPHRRPCARYLAIYIYIYIYIWRAVARMVLCMASRRSQGF